MKDIFSVRDKVVVVTGGLGQLGTQFSKSLAEAGAKVAIYSRRAIAPADCIDTDTLVAGGPDQAFVFSKGRLVSKSATENIARETA